ncbi:MAG: DNA translocase FtsK [Eubacteriales bacterium]|nr:DNA translocase FtsK [Eubacteriales bacterium]
MSTNQKKGSTAKSRKSSSASSGKGRSAAGKKSTAGKKTTAKAAPRSSAADLQRQERRRLKKQYELQRDLQLVLILAVGVLIFLSCFGLCGKAGAFISRFCFGMFGWLAYVFVFLFIYIWLFALANGAKREALVRILSLVGLYILLDAFLQLVQSGGYHQASLAQIYTECASDRSGGGLIGGMIVQLIGKAFGTSGCYVIIVAALIGITLLLTQKPLLSVIQEKGERAYANRDIYREEKYERRLKRQELRDEARYRRERELAIRDLQKKRRTDARRKAEIARRVDPQTIESDGAITRVEGEEITPITAESNSDLSAKKRSRRSGGKDSAAVKKDAARDSYLSDEELFRYVPRDQQETGTKVTAAPETAEPVFTPDAISDDIISNSTVRRKRRTIDTFRQEEAEITPPDVQNRTDVPAAESIPQDKLDAIAVNEEPAHKAEPEDPSGENGSDEEQKYVSRRGKPSVGTPDAIVVPEEEEIEEYVFPPMELLTEPKHNNEGESNEMLKETAVKLQQTLHTFGVEVTINHISCGPSVTRYELTPEMGVKVSKIVNLQDDIKLNLAAEDIRIEAPIPGKAAIGIEVPNKSTATVTLRELLEDPVFIKHKSKLAFAVGKDIAGQTVVADIFKMPHLLIAGATGSGKSVCINTLIMSIIYKSRPDEVKFIMIDPKVVELSVYNGIPHLLIPVVTDPKKAAGALQWAVSEMESRYDKFADMGVRDLAGYNAKVEAMPDPEDGEKPKKLSRIVIIVDELADLMMVAQNEVEGSICRLAQLARACGIHLIIATQRPSVNVITGLIKANMPSRIALSVTSGVDSRTIIDMVGAEKLLGKGDMLFYPQGYAKPARVQGAFLSDQEIAGVVQFLKDHRKVITYSQAIQDKINSQSSGSVSPSGDVMDTDAYFTEAGKLIIEKDKASIGMLQRAFRIGFNRAARIMDQLCDAGVVGEEEGTKPRKILMTMAQFENYLEEN